MTALRHHGSHRQLLADVPSERALAKVDAIIVPTARTASSLTAAITLALELQCVLVALCSRQSNARAAAELGGAAGIELVAIDVDGLPEDLMPHYRTTALLVEAGFDRGTDTSLKRNLGLLLARLSGWERIVFLDDDIAVPDPDDLRAAAKLLDGNAGVGLAIGGYPDNSVVCHAYREAGGTQDTFIGGGALAVDTRSVTSFFPEVYNEDWFFLLDDNGLRRSTVTGLATQRPYDPFAETGRARSEEFGDCLAEGVFALLDNGGKIKDAKVEYWGDFLAARREFVEEVIKRVRSGGRPDADRMIAALEAARERNLEITPELCVGYLDAWQQDLRNWQKHVTDRHELHADEMDVLPGHGEVRGLSPAKALVELGLMGCGEHVPPRRPAS